METTTSIYDSLNRLLYKIDTAVTSFDANTVVDPNQIASGVSSAVLNSTGSLAGGQTAYNTGVGYFLGYDGDGIYKFSIGDPSANYVTWDGSTLTISGSISVGVGGTVGGFDVGTDYVRDVANSFGLASTITGGDDVRFWAGDTFANRATADFFVTEAGAVTAANITITGGSVPTSVLTGTLTSASLNLADRGWTQTSAFSVTDADTVAWGAGTFTASDATAYSIGGGNTGNMAAKTYIYLDIGVSTTAYQTTTTAAIAVGSGKVLIAVAENNTTEATFQVFGGIGGQNIDASSIVAASITANEIAASTITAGKLTITSLSSITANMGAITAGTITLDTSGYLRGGSTDYLTGTGFFLGYSGGAYKFSAGNPSGDYVAFDGTNVILTLPVSVDVSLTAGEALTVGNAVGLYGELTSSSTVSANAATYVRSDTPTTNYDGLSPFKIGATPSHNALLFFPGLAALEPSGTGITILTYEIRFIFNIESYPAEAVVSYDSNTASFTESTVTWNTKPTTSGTSTFDPYPINTPNGVQTSAWGTLTAQEYSDLKTYGCTLTATTDPTNVVLVSDEDQADPPKIQVRYTYKIRDGKAYKVKATTVEYANSFLGIAQSTVAAAASVKVRTEGKDSNQSGLSATFGTTYYLSNTLGAISTSAGTKTFIVGRNLSTTELQIKYSLNQAV